MHPGLACTLLVLAATASAAAGEDAVEDGRPSPFLVRFDDTVRNETETTLRDVACAIHLPVDGPGQHVRWLRLSDHDWRVESTPHGRVGRATVARLAPGEAVTFSWLAAVDLADVREPHRSAPPGPEALSDDAALDLEHDEVVRAADAVRAAASDAAAASLVAAALRHVRKTVRYELDTSWRPAPEVLAEGRGSCSESVFALVAVCRRLGVPARWVGGTLPRGRTGARGVDATFHRIAEVWLDSRGWVALEATGDVAPTDEEVWATSAPPERFLVLARGGSSSDAAGLYYHARNEWLAPKGLARPAARVTKRAYWVADDTRFDELTHPLEGLDEGMRPSLARCERLLALLDRAPARDVAVEELGLLLAAGHPGTLRLAARVARARAARRSDVEDLLRRHCDAAVAEAVSALLTESAAAFEAWWTDVGLDVAATYVDGRPRITLERPTPSPR